MERMLGGRNTWRLVGAAGLPNEGLEVAAPEHTAWRRNSSHAHPYREVLVALEGRCLCSHGARIFFCEPGVFFFFDAFEKHDLAYPPWTGNLLHLWCAIADDAVIGRFCRVENGSAKMLPEATLSIFGRGIPEILNTAWGLAEQPRLSPAIRGEAMRAAITSLLCGLLVEGLKDEDAGGSGGRKKVLLIRTMQEHIKNNLGRGISLESLARMSGFSKYYFLRLFKQHAGCTVHEYINSIRRQKVAEMRQRGCREKEIAFDLGFASPISFSSWQRKHAQ